MKLVTFLFVLQITLGLAIGLDSEIQMIVDVVKSYHTLNGVLAKVCWKTSDILDVTAKIMDTEISKTIQFINNLNVIEKHYGDNMLVVLDLNCKDSERFLQQAHDNKKFNKPYRWLILPKKQNANVQETLIPEELKNLTILVDSEVILAGKTEENEILLQLIYRIDSTSGFITEVFGTWNNELHLSKDLDIATAMRRNNLKGKSIRISVVITDNSTKTEIYKLENFMTDVYAKTTFHNFLPLYNFMNATTDLVFTDTWGYLVNNRWNGMIGQISQGEAELCGSMILMTPQRHTSLAFLTTSVPVNIRFVFRQPPLSFQNNLFILPFNFTVWLCIGALIVILMVVIYVNAVWESTKDNGMKSDDPTTLRPNVSDIAMFIAGAITQQGNSSELKGSRGRVVTFIMLLIFLFLYTSYAANIVVLLQSTSDQIHTLSDLLNSRLELGVEEQPYNRHYFTTATDPVRKAIYETKVSKTGYKPNFMTLQEGVKRLQNSKTPFAFHMHLGLGYKVVEQYFQESEKCGLREVQYVPKGDTYSCCRKHSPYQEIYKIGLVRILEHGITDRLSRLVNTRKPACTTRGASFGSVNMVDFHPVLLCLLYGMIVSALLLVLEILVHRRKLRYEEMNILKTTE